MHSQVYHPYLLINKKRYAGLLWTNPDKWDKMDSKVPSCPAAWRNSWHTLGLAGSKNMALQLPALFAGSLVLASCHVQRLPPAGRGCAACSVVKHLAGSCPV